MRSRLEAEVQLKPLLREFLEERERVPSPRHNFLPNFARDRSLPVIVEPTPWSRTDSLEISIRFQRREDLQDFVNCYLELEEETGTYACLTIDGFSVRVTSEEQLPPRFKSMIEEIARETHGN
jgi:hypothetical protein